MARAATSLPVPLSPSSSTVASVGATLRDRVDHRRHRRVAVGRAAASPASRARRARAIEQAAPLERARRPAGAARRAADRLLQVVEGAELHRLDRGVDGAVRGQHDRPRPRAARRGRLRSKRHAVERRACEIGDHQVEAARVEQRRARPRRPRRCATSCPSSSSASARNCAARLVVGDQDARHQVLALERGARCGSSAPPPGALPAVIVPPCSSTMRRATARPSPVPRVLLVKNGSKIRSRVAGRMPGPRSRTSMTRRPSLARRPRRRPGARRATPGSRCRAG